MPQAVAEHMQGIADADSDQWMIWVDILCIIWAWKF